MTNQVALSNARKIDPKAVAGSSIYKIELGIIYAAAIANGAGDTEEKRHVFSVVKNFGKFLSTEINTLGNNVIVVAHSQGNFFAEAVDAYLRYNASPAALLKYDENLKFVGAASVAASVPNNRYISIGEDKALDAHVAATAGIFPFSVLSRNADICDIADIPCYTTLLAMDPPSMHGFLEIYTSDAVDRLTGNTLSQLLSSGVYQSYIEISERNCGTITPPSIFEQLGPNYSVDAGKSTKFLTTPSFKRGNIFTTYRWKTSEGVEIGTGVEQANIMFTAIGTGSITVTPVLADGTVCTGSAATSAVTVVSNKILNPENGHTYEVITCGTWSQCRDAALAMGGKLVTIRSQAETDWLVTNMLPLVNSTKNVWIGYFKETASGKFQWASGELPSFEKWIPGEPNNSGGTENCVNTVRHVTYSGYWNDIRCDHPDITQAIIEYGPSASVVQWKPSDPNVPWRNDGHIVGGWWTYSDIPYSGYVQIVRMRLPTPMRIGDLSIAFKLRGSGANADAHMLVGNDFPTASDSTNMYPYYAFYTGVGGGSVVERDINLAVAPTEIMGNASCPNDNVAYCNQDKLVSYVMFHFRDSKDIDYLRVRSKGQLVLNLDF